MRLRRRRLSALALAAIAAGLAATVQAAPLNPPQINGVSPGMLVQPGQQLTLSGTGFSDTNNDCSLGAPSITVHPLDGGSDYSLSPDSGFCSASSVRITLSLPNGHPQWSAAQLYMTDNHGKDSRGGGLQPIVTVVPTASITPSHGEVGTRFSINGTNLDPPSVAGPLHISFPATSVESGWGNMISNLDPGNQAGDVALAFPVHTDVTNQAATTTVNVAAGHYTFDAPALTGLSPDSTTVGQPITITGTNLGGQRGSVQFNGVGGSTTPSSWSDQQLTATVPPGAQPGPVRVNVPGFSGTLTTSDLSLLPVVRGISPAQAAPGSVVTVSGYNFGGCNGSSCLASIAGSAQRVTAWADQAVSFVLAPDVDPGPVQLTRGDGKTAASAPLGIIPKLTQLEQNNVQPGAVVVADGLGLGSQQGTVSLAGQSLTPQLWSRTSVLVQVPLGVAPGKYNLVVASASGVASNALSLTIVAAPPSPKPGSSAAAASNPTEPHFDNKHDFVKPIPPPSPVRLTLDAEPKKVAPGGSATLTVTLQLNGKPVNGAQVKLSLIFSPCSQDAFSADHGTTDSTGTFKSTLTLCAKPGQRVVLAESGLFSDQDAVVATGAKNSAASAPTPVNPASGVPTPLLALGGVAVALVGAGVFVNLRSHGWI